MANPKRRHSKARRNRRRAHDHLTPQTLAFAGRSEDAGPKCPHCHEPKLPHHVCPHCGFYGPPDKGREVILVEAPA